MIFIVIGVVGFIGVNIVKVFNECGEMCIIVVDNLICVDKFCNFVDCEIDDYFDKIEFVECFVCGDFGKVCVVFYEGVCLDMMEIDGCYMMDNNFCYSCVVFDICFM